MQQPQQMDERLMLLNKLMESAEPGVKAEFQRLLDLSWIHHDSSLEGTIFLPDELQAALRGEAPEDPSLIPTFDEIRQNKAAVDLCRDMATRKKFKIDLDAIRELYACLAPDEVEGKKPPQYRKDMPLHRLYFHEIATPDKIVVKLRQFTDWANDADTRKSTHTVRMAAKAHYYLLQIYPFPKHSGKIARLVMNLILLSGGYPPAIIHSTERQRYYDALKSNENAVAQVVREALESSIESAIRYFEMHAPPPPPPSRKRRSSAAKTAAATTKVAPPTKSTRGSAAVLTEEIFEEEEEKDLELADSIPPAAKNEASAKSEASKVDAKSPKTEASSAGTVKASSKSTAKSSVVKAPAKAEATKASAKVEAKASSAKGPAKDKPAKSGKGARG